MHTPRSNLPLLFLLAIAGVIFLSGLGRFPFKDYDEAFYATVSSEMVESGNYLHFTRNGDPWLERPPLLFWLVGASVKIFGFNEFALRLPGALLGLATIFLTYAFALAVTKNKPSALLAAGILLTTSQFVYSARELRFDVPVAFGILLAVYSFWRGWQKPVWYIGVGAGFAAAIMFKSVVAIFIPLIFLVFSFAYKEWRWLKNPLFWGSIATGLLLVAPWHILQYQTYGDKFVYSYIMKNSFGRYSEAILGGRNQNPFYFFVLAAKIIEPWFALFAAGTVWFMVKRKKIQSSSWYQPLLAMLLSVFAIVLPFSFSKSKLFSYFDPIYPFFAVFLALLGLFLYQKMKPSSQKISLWVTGAILLFGLVNTVWQISEFRGWPRGAGEYAIAKDERAVSDILNAQTDSQKVFTLFHFSYDTINFYTRTRAEPMIIEQLEKTLDRQAFFLLVPTKILASIELSPLILLRANIVFGGKELTLFSVAPL